MDGHSASERPENAWGLSRSYVYQPTVAVIPLHARRSPALLAFTPHLVAQNFSEEEQEAWSALETQLAHVYAGEWDKNQEYLHPDGDVAIISF
jgi:hypothetical protein